MGTNLVECASGAAQFPFFNDVVVADYKLAVGSKVDVKLNAFTAFFLCTDKGVKGVLISGKLCSGCAKTSVCEDFRALTCRGGVRRNFFMMWG